MSKRNQGYIMICVWITVMLVVVSGQGNVRQVQYRMVEEAPSSTQVGSIQTDARLTGLSLEYSFLSQKSAHLDYFTIDKETGLLKTAKIIDRDVICPHMFTCDLAFDVGALAPDRSFIVIKVTVTIVDLNDNGPVFAEDRKDLVISETSMPNTSFSLPSVFDPDSGVLGIQGLELQGGGGKFWVQTSNETDGTVDLRLVLKDRLDREDTGYYAMTLVARDGGSPPLSGTLAIGVTVEDANDNIPVFVNQSYTVKVNEDTPIDTSILQVKAVDRDEGLNGEVVYTFDPNTQRQYGNTFSLNNVSGVIRLQRPLDYETLSTYNLMVTATDRGPNGVPVQVKVTIEVGDINDHAPIITASSLTDTGRVEVPENADAGGFVAHVSVEDPDSGLGGQVTCSASGGPFKLEPLYQNDFTLTTTKVLDREQQASYLLTLTCADQGTPSLTSSTEVTINVLDKNDNDPKFSQSKYSASVWENNSVGIPVVQVNASDDDTGDNAKLTYSLQGPKADLLMIDPNSGIISAAASLDYESVHMLSLTVIARDQGKPSTRSATASLTISIVDINDNTPKFDKDFYETEVLENYIPDKSLVDLSATDLDSYPFNEVAFSLDGDPEIMSTFQVDSRTGALSLKKALDREYKSLYVFKAMASNVGYPDVFSTVDVHVRVLDVNDNAPTILFPSLSNNTVHLSSKAPTGYFFTRIEARDADMGINAQLAFSFAKPPQDDMFDIDSKFGAISLKRPAREAPSTFYTLMVEVRDEGNPPKSAVTELNVVVNRSLAFVRDEYSDYVNDNMTVTSSTLSQSETILISLAVVTLLLVTVLVVAIVLVKRRQYKCDDDVPHDAISVDLSSSNDSRSHKSSNSTNSNNLSSDSYDSSRSKKDVKFGTSNLPPVINTDTKKEGGAGFVNGQPAVTLVKLQNDLGKERGVKIKSEGCYNISSGMVSTKPSSNKAKSVPRHRITATPDETLAKPWSLTKKELAVHKLLQRMSTPPAEDSDSASGCSADVSNTDSGRGPSEDGDRASPSPEFPSLNNQTDTTQSSSAVKGRGATSPSTLRKGASQAQGHKRPWHHQSRTQYKPHLRTIVEPDNKHVYYTDYSQQKVKPSNTDPLLPQSSDARVPSKSHVTWDLSDYRIPPDNYSIGPTSTLDDSDGASTTSGSYILEMSEQRPSMTVGHQNTGSFV